MKSRYLGWLGIVILLPGLGIFPSPGQSAQVIQVDVEHVIHPLTVELVQEAIRQADEEAAAAVLLRLNTPGGLLSAAKDVIQTIVASDVPIIAYVGPSGGRAASAGFMILVSADVAAMAPGTNTGAAHPVLMGSEMDEVMKAKVSNDTAASVRSVTSKRGRNPEVAEKAVLESKSFTEREALDEKLIEYIAPDVKDLLAKLDGKTIKRFDGSETTLALADAGVVPFELSYRQSILLALIDPNLAFILFVLGLVGVYVEFSNPGLIVPGVGGAILMILGAMALTVLPINWAAAALVVWSGVALENFYLALVLLGIGWNFGFIGSTSLLAEHVRPEDQSRVQGLNETLIALGAAIASFGSGALTVTLGWSTFILTSIPLFLIPALWLARSALVHRRVA